MRIWTAVRIRYTWSLGQNPYHSPRTSISLFSTVISRTTLSVIAANAVCTGGEHLADTRTLRSTPANPDQRASLGVILGSRVLAEFGDDPHRFAGIARRRAGRRRALLRWSIVVGLDRLSG
jgi:hypothetical protein